MEVLPDNAGDIVKRICLVNSTGIVMEGLDGRLSTEKAVSLEYHRCAGRKQPRG
jgi:hypothetical protein